MIVFNKKIYQNLFILFSFSIPIQGRIHILPTIIGAILLILLPFTVKKKDLFKLKNIIFLLYFILILWIVIITILTKRYEDIKIIKKMIIPLLIFIISLPKLKVKSSIIGFVLGSVITFIISIINIIVYAKEKTTFQFANGEEINNILYTERPYLGYISVMSFCLLMYLKHFAKNTFQIVLIYILSAGIFLFLFVISARLSIITVFLIIIYLILIGKILYKYKIGLFVFLIAIAIGAFFTNNNLKERFFINKYDDLKFSGFIKEEPRTYIWNCVFEYLGENPITFKGIGFYNIEKYMTLCFSSSNKFINNGQREWFVKNHYNTHNQFLDFYLGGGIIAFVLFLSLFLILIFKLYKNKFSISLIFSLGLFCLFENMLHRQEGGYLFGITLILTLILYCNGKTLN